MVARKLHDYVNPHISGNVQFTIPEIDENFVYTFLSSFLEKSKAIGLDRADSDQAIRMRPH